LDLNRLAANCVFGSDWPGAPGIATNARAIAKLDLDDETLREVLGGNARRVYRGL
jgi:predicted TIM-barrel fold metal-dependent hydrolase